MNHKSPNLSLQDIPLLACCVMCVALLISLVQEGLR